MATLQQVTVRLPESVVEALRSEARETGRSLNDVAGTVLGDYTARRAALRAVRDVAGIRARIQAERGQQPDSTEILRSLRRGDDRR